ncbi:hypothetical protein COT97_01075 [Candidatus Falkowbacteria bacterium CG10_big_fil_rev_8_21_14_0_10_39_11]|uniref:Uncharacterized protein n=1 Tax=Candidatus Falkowbacteria bacterium CG10_big_fil_rev_8_21_14_0_10_39_11 TaxID=1974565 RepID=A0A2H0V630_9BACT|nr:MAG: hypothetical protein COT97_01075 [Candidatus Falkowbacteria bacterium CG10_big_fil_rev_8_21_14_0_10_39_11]
MSESINPVFLGAIVLGALVGIIFLIMFALKYTQFNSRELQNIFLGIHERGYKDAANGEPRDENYFKATDSGCEKLSSTLRKTMNSTYLKGYDRYLAGEPSLIQMLDKQIEALDHISALHGERMKLLKSYNRRPKQLEFDL